ncbi:hypothetical protein E1263_15210 [Kribbella antibiotica]|uniref:Uncharacterized protein n=1 Tax=Kribbella antibiotica TaxID=190195 RepID=A0A4R4ZNR3_9ACTN|nr:hypothetical protein [Kribbella antibiotica]TDD59389.1 hypothetical protein E1263_15210 [Kribbella antibiotica]
MKVVAERLLLAVAALVMLGFGYINAGLNTYLPTVTSDQDVWAGQAKDLTWFALLAGWSLAMIVCVGFPRRAGGSFWRAKGSEAGAVVQGLSGLVAAAGVGLAAAILFNITPWDLGESPCRYVGSCWPNEPQMYSRMVPGLIGALAMFVMACLVLWVPWWIRVLTPVVLWVAAVITLHAIWVPVLLPIFTGPPR